MKIAIVGSRNFNNYQYMKEKIESLKEKLNLNKDEIEIVSGDVKVPML